MQLLVPRAPPRLRAGGLPPSDMAAIVSFFDVPQAGRMMLRAIRMMTMTTMMMMVMMMLMMVIDDDDDVDDTAAHAGDDNHDHAGDHGGDC